MSVILLHCHHDILAEFGVGDDPLAERIASIKATKPAHEQETRLRVLRVVDSWPPFLAEAQAKFDEVWAELTKAQVKFTKAQAELNEVLAEFAEVQPKFNKALAKLNEAWAKFAEAQAKFDEVWATPEAMAWHASVCVKDCPWDGHTLFP